MVFFHFQRREKTERVHHVQKFHRKSGFDGLAYDRRFLVRELEYDEAFGFFVGIKLVSIIRKSERKTIRFLNEKKLRKNKIKSLT